jgi:arsenite oxidase small subunit
MRLRIDRRTWRILGARLASVLQSSHFQSPWPISETSLKSGIWHAPCSSENKQQINGRSAVKTCDRLVDIGRRQFLRGGATTAIGGVAAVAISGRDAKAAQPLARVSYPSNNMGNVRDLKVNEPIDITYPDSASPGILLKLGKAVEGGVGPDNDIVAFSTVCPHKGFPLAYVAADGTLNCPGHYSRFDCEKGGQQIWGQATQNLPQFVLRVDDKGDIYAEAVDELLYGRLSNVLQA